MWEQIRYNQTRTAMLIAGMGVLLLVLGLAISLSISFLLDVNLFESIITGVVIAAILWLLAILLVYFGGDDMLLELAAAREISPPEYPRLFNIVEELRIASGLEKTPSLYIVDDPAMNAFAIGCRQNKAAIVVTSGLLTKLNRDELQGVIGHEIAHIANRDVLLMSFCIMLLDMITVLVSLAVRGFAELSGWGIAMVSFVLLMLAVGFTISPGLVGPMLPFGIALYILAFAVSIPKIARFIYYASSRRREYLADVSSALYTRYPEGLALALEKIAASTEEVLAASPAIAPIYIVNPFRSGGLPASDITSTHPPISERIRILRAMAHVSYAEYDRAYREIRGIDRSVIPAYALATAETAAMRAAVPDDLDYIQRARETSNALWNAQKYNIVNCACGTRMRLPPSFKLPEVKCPHCGRINPV